MAAAARRCRSRDSPDLSRHRKRRPFPEARLWDRIKDPVSRVEAALAAHYDYFAGTRGMWSVVYRDVGLVKPIQPVLAHALGFAAWVSLETRGLDTEGKVALVLHWLDGLCKTRA